MHKRLMNGLIAGSLLINAACAATATPVGEAAGTTESSDTTMSDTESQPGPATGALAALAVQTLTQHLSVPENTVKMLRLTAVDWPDSSLGCPQPGMNYMQVITPGHYAVLKHGDRIYRVHMAGKHAFVCETAPGIGDKQPPVPLLKLPQERLITLARADLARRLSAETNQITMKNIRKFEWPDASLGCPEKGKTYASVATPGYVLTMEYDGSQYTYHADQHRVLPCPPIETD